MTTVEISGVKFDDLRECIVDKIDRSFYFVQATSDEQFFLWKQYANNSDNRDPGLKRHWVEWKQENPGHIIEIGQLDKRPVVVSMFWINIEGRRVCFYESTSQVVDWVRIDEFIKACIKRTGQHKKQDRWPHCDAMNFGHCIGSILEANKKPI